MKSALFWITLFAASLLSAQTAAPVDLDQLKEGDEIPKGGVYWDLQDGEGKINLRFDGNKLRLYFTDTSNLLIKPTFSVALVRYYNDLRNSVKVPRDVATMTISDTGLYLSSNRILQPPLRYRVWIVLQHSAPNASAMQDDEDTPGKQSYGMRILNGIGTGSNTELGD